MLLIKYYPYDKIRNIDYIFFNELLILLNINIKKKLNL